MQAKKSDAVKMGKTLAGLQIRFMIDQRFRVSETDNSAHEAEHLFSIKLCWKAIASRSSLCHGTTFSTGLEKALDEQTLRALLLLNLRRLKAMDQDLASDSYDRLPPGHEEKSYDYLLRCEDSPLSTAA